MLVCVIHSETVSEHLLIHWALSRFQECTFEDPVLFTKDPISSDFSQQNNILCICRAQSHNCVLVLMGSASCCTKSWPGFKAFNTSRGTRQGDKPRQCIIKHRHHFANKRLQSQNYGLSSSHVRMRELDHREVLSAKGLMLSNCGVGEASWESRGLQGNQTSPS